MSSTNRSKARDEHISDYYVSPITDVELFLNKFQEVNPLDWNNLKILDPCAGGNEEIRDEYGIKEVFHPMSYPVAIENCFGACNVDTYDIRKDSLAEYKCDYLQTKLDYKPNVIISNPPFNCFSSDTEIKTKEGWKLYTELKEDDEVLSCNIETQELQWSKINCIIEKYYNGDIIHFKHRFLDMIVTPNHRMFSYKNSKPEFNKIYNDVVFANDIGYRSYIPKKGYVWNGKNSDNFILDGCYISDGQKDVWHEPIVIKMELWAQFLGIWLADGYYRHTLNSQGNRRYTCGIKQAESNDAKLIELLNQLPFEYKIYKDYKTNKNNYEIHSKQLWLYLNQFGYSKDKFVPQYIKDASKNILKLFLDAYIYGDSCKVANGYELTSISKRLMEDIHEVILKLGYLSHIRCNDIKYKGEEYPIYSISYCPNKTTQNRIYYCSDYKYKTVEKYEGKVFCLNLEKNGFFLLRRNKYEFFSGNCAISIIKKALEDVEDNGYVIMLLRLNFFGSKERKPFFDEYMPEYCFIHHSRIGFTDKKDENGYIVFDKLGKPKKGSTDSIEYAHFVWRKGYKPEYTKTYVI